ncbi:TetR/AcrR family transcriptional regulator [Catenovulum adriaticum]|uniref:TetR/AcrR family transcriptional regulator n=1 Tax=Catenovulum adriaticum TaxID=2984846 RepID=A0ABY7AL58_9ALTE|nr:TetR/AcrR family transcriptional regulator [Catenovulum sp. TS8]WAJ70274.1 TetR/AcrR family transcriptional regulator [Catenovulum sp. TS8]
MARRSDHTREELRQLIIDALVAHLQDQPYQTLSIRQLSKQVGYVPSSILNVFGSYQLCWLEVCAGVLDDLYQVSAQALSNVSEQAENAAEQKILAVALAYYFYASNKPYFWKLVFDLRLAQGQAMPDWQSQRIEQLFLLLQSALAELKPTASQNELADTSRALWASVHGITQLALEDKLFSKGASGEQLLEQLLNHFLASWKNH